MIAASFFFFINSVHVNVNESENDAIAFERIEMKIGYFRDTPLVGNVDFTQTGLN